MESIRKRFRDSKLRHKLMAIYICIGTIPVLILGIVVYYQQRTGLLEKEQQTMETALSQGVSQLGTQLSAYENLSDYIAFNSTISQVLSEEYDSVYKRYEQYAEVIDPVLSSLQYFHPGMKQLTIYVGEEVVDHDTTVASLKELEGSDWYRNAHLNQNGTWFVEEESNQAFHARKMPIMVKNGKDGVLYISVDYNTLFAGLGELSKEEYGIAVCDREGKIIYHSEHFSGEEQHLTDSQIEKQFEDNEKKQNSSYMIVSRSMKEQGWKLLLYCPKDMVTIGADSTLLLVFGLAAICVLTSLVAAFAFSKLVVKDLEKLQKNMEDIEQGDMTIWVERDARDEMGNLIRGFKRMIGEIERLIHEVYEGKLLQRQYEMKALQAQINPHFLYNSLSLINWKALEAGKEDISKLTLALSTFYRTSLNRGNNVLTIERELENMKSYLEIQSCMHDNSFDVEIEIDESILTYETLNLVLQPLVENAIEHGVDLLEDRRGCIRITGTADEKNIYLAVEDNGVGMEKEVLDSILEFKTRGYGVRNVNARIKLFYGDAYALRIESEWQQGTKCIVTIPKERKKDEQ